MNVVCRLMCREEIESAMRGEEVKKGNKGEQIYEHIVGSQLSFSPIKYSVSISFNLDLASFIFCFSLLHTLST